MNDEMDKDLILEFSKLIDNPAMLAIKDKIQQMLEYVPKSPAYYAENPDKAHLFSGYELAIQELNNFIFNYMQYAIEDEAEKRQD